MHILVLFFLLFLYLKYLDFTFDSRADELSKAIKEEHKLLNELEQELNKLSKISATIIEADKEIEDESSS